MVKHGFSYKARARVGVQLKIAFDQLEERRTEGSELNSFKSISLEVLSRGEYYLSC